jgi:CBS domain-containing protein
VAGKADWLAAGEPTEGPQAGRARIGAIADRDVVTCGLDTPVAEVARRLNGLGLAVVVHGRVVLGVVREQDLDDRSGRPVGELMEEAPSTLRADLPVEELAPRLAEVPNDAALVTTPEGALIGLVSKTSAGTQ